MARILILLFGVTGYATFLATFLYLIGFVTGLLVPVTVDAGGPSAPLWTAVAIDVALVIVFGLQHSVMARPWFKRTLGTIVAAAIERTMFMLATCAVFALMFSAWRPAPAPVWSLRGVLGQVVFALGFAGWGIALLSTFLIDHFDLFGLRQTWCAFRGRTYPPRGFQVRSLYRHVRHPLMLGLLVAFWAAPTMTVGRLVLAASFTLYIAIAVAIEERDLIALHGGSYREYQRRVPRFIPFARILAPRAARTMPV